MGESERQMGELKILPSIALQFESRWHARTGRMQMVYKHICLLV